MDKQAQKEVLSLAERGMKIRAIAKRLGLDRKTVRRMLGPKPPPPSPSPGKLTGYEDLVRERLKQDLTVPRILREIRERGYTGSKTILAEYVREIRGPVKEPARPVLRFETKPGVEAQVDWSPYRLVIGGKETVVHCFSMVLCFSRRLAIDFYRNERLPTLLHAHAEAFLYHEGFCTRLVYDNQTTVTLGRLRGQPLWHPVFLEFAKHHGFTPWVCKPKDPKRKGKVERPFLYIESDFLRGSTFSSLDDLNRRARVWLDTVANVRFHTTIRRNVEEAYAEERPFLIARPSLPFPTDRREVRKVGVDGTVCIDASFYPVPARFIGRHVTVRVYPDRVEVLDAAGEVVITHKVPDRPGRIAADGTTRRPPSPPSPPATEARFLSRFPRAADFLAGLKARMNALTPIHLREISRLADLYGDGAVRAAMDRAQEYGNYNAAALRRILEVAWPHVFPEPPPVVSDPAALGALDDVEAASPEHYTLDSDPPTEGDADAR